MILNLVPVLFHLLFYQYLIFQLLVLIRRALLHKAHSAERLTCRKAVEGASIQRARAAPVLGSEGCWPLFSMKTLPVL